MISADPNPHKKHIMKVQFQIKWCLYDTVSPWIGGPLGPTLESNYNRKRYCTQFNDWTGSVVRYRWKWKNNGYHNLDAFVLARRPSNGFRWMLAQNARLFTATLLTWGSRQTYSIVLYSSSFGRRNGSPVRVITPLLRYAWLTSAK